MFFVFVFVFILSLSSTFHQLLQLMGSNFSRRREREESEIVDPKKSDGPEFCAPDCSSQHWNRKCIKCQKSYGNTLATIVMLLTKTKGDFSISIARNIKGARG